MRYLCLLASLIIFLEHPLNASEKRGPDFLIIGTVKGGSTSLWRYLSEHPQILAGKPKEIHYFDLSYNKGMDWYMSHFRNIKSTEEKLLFEATPAYLDRPNVAERVAKDYPSIKLIIVLRNPVDRLFSHYRLFMRRRICRGKSIIPLRAMIRRHLAKMRLSNVRLPPNSYHVMIRQGMYIDHINRWLQLFPKEQIHILTSEDLFEDPTITLKKVYDFLGIQDHTISVYPCYNKGQKDGLIFPHEVKKQLEEFYRPLNEQLQTFLKDEMELDLELNW